MLLAFARPWSPELDADEAGALRDHLAGCPACAAQAERAQRADDQLGRAVRAVPMPEGLHGRLLDHLAAERAVRRRRRVLRVAAVAAALLLALTVGWYVRLSMRPVVDADEIAREFDRRAYNAPEKVQEWFLEQCGVAMVAPTQVNDAPLNYDLLVWYEMVEFQRVPVPQLVFFHQGTGALARLYVLSDRSFNLDETLRTQAAGSNHRVEVFRQPDNPHVVYVIVYTGESLTPFIIRQQRGA